MCNPASGVFTKGHIAHWSKYSDSHEYIIEEHKLNADGVGGPNIVRFEITPPDGDMTKPLADWSYKVDQDILPDWYDPKEGEAAARKMLTEWAGKKVITGESNDLADGEYFIVGNATVSGVRGNATVSGVWDNATVSGVWANATVSDVWDNATVSDVRGNATVSGVRDNATVSDVRGNATIITYVKQDQGCMLSASAVMIDRSVNPPVCYVGVRK